MNHIVHRILTFPGIAVDEGVSAVGTPGPERLRSSLVVESGDAETGNLVIIEDPDFQAPPLVTRHPLDAPATHNGDSLVGIGIAPDSAISACTLYVDGQEHRVTAGNPFVGSGFPIEVGLPMSIPSLPADLDADFIAWDAVRVPVGDGHVYGWPLKLEMYYGEIPQRASRDVYRGHVTVIHENDSQNSTVYFMVDGRRNVELRVISPAQNAAAGARIFRVDAVPTLRVEGGARFDTAVTTEIMGVSALFDGLNNFVLAPMSTTLIAIEILGSFSSGVNNGAYQVSIVAY